MSHPVARNRGLRFLGRLIHQTYPSIEQTMVTSGQIVDMLDGRRPLCRSMLRAETFALGAAGPLRGLLALSTTRVM